MRLGGSYIQDFVVTCNCGDQALILFDPDERDWHPAEAFASDGWNFDTTPTLVFPIGKGWNCGKVGRHWQRRAAGVPVEVARARYYELLEQVTSGEILC